MSRISPGTIIVAIFAVLFGLVGAYAIKKNMNQKTVVEAPKATPPASDPYTNIPLAATDLMAGREIKLGDIAIARVRQSQVKNMKLPGEYMMNPQQIIGRTLSEAIHKGQTFQPSRLYPEGLGPSIAERVKPGMRAVTIGVHGTGILGGLAGVGTIVDVLFRTKEDVGKEIPEMTMTLLEGIEVLAVEENIIPGAKNPDTVASVTLSVNPRQANVLKIMEGRGEFSLALRADGDETLISHNGPQTLHALLNIPPKAKPKQIEIYRGGARSVLTFSNERAVEDFTNANLKPVTETTPKTNPQASGTTPTSATQVIDLVGGASQK